MTAELILASNNPHKVFEIKAVIGNNIKIRTLNEIGFTDEIPENELTLQANAIFKARTIHRSTGLNVFSDDTGLEVIALDGAPGVHSARYSGEARDPEANIIKLLSNMQNVTDRRARFRTVIALIWENEEHLFEGVIEGEITKQPSGENGFGYDPVFKPAGYNKTFAELTDMEKNKISHRALATAKLINYLESQFSQ